MDDRVINDYFVFKMQNYTGFIVCIFHAVVIFKRI